MANQPKKYKKFVATAATATLVASAIVPVASAAGFSDVAGNDHEVAINALADAGIINGYADGSFKPNQTINRGQVVKLLGRYLEAQGQEIPADWNSKQRFNDLPVTAEEELVKYAALAKDAGVFNGSNGNLNASQTMQRQQMAVVLVRAIKEIAGVDLVAEYKKANFVTEIGDLDKAYSAEQRTAIVALEYAGITNVAHFNPGNSVTRGQFASFLYRTIENVVNNPEAGVAAVKAINNTTVEVTFDEEVDNVQALNFLISDLEVKNAAVKLTNKKVVVLTTAAQTADKEYTVSLGEEKIGTFKGIAAVVPTKVDLVEKSVQGKLGQQVTLKAQVTVAEGQTKAGIPVTFFIPGSANGVKTPVTVEAVTNEEGIATYSYTRYAATNDTVTVYANGDRSKFSTGYVFWAVDQTLEITEVTTGATINNGANKTYKVTYKHPETGKPVSGKVLNVSVKENIDVTVDKLQNVTVNGIAVVQTSDNNTRAAQITTDSKGEATFTVSGSNAEVTPVVFEATPVQVTNTNGAVTTTSYTQKYTADILQASAAKVTFGAVQAAYTLEVTRDGGEVAATGVENGRKYNLVVKDKDGKLAANETVNVAFNEDIDGVISTVTSAEFVKVENDKQVRYEGKKITVKTNSKGEASFVISSEAVNTYATPIAWIDINNQSAKDANLDKGEPSAVAPISYFQAEYLDGSKLVSYKDTTETDKFTGSETATFKVQLTNQSGKVVKNSGYTTPNVSYTVYNTGANNVKVDGVEIAPNRVHTVVAKDGVINVTTVDNKSSSVKVLATGVAKQTNGNKEFAFTSKEATATFTATNEVSNPYTGAVKHYNTDKKTITFDNKDAIKYAGVKGKTYKYFGLGSTPIANADAFIATLSGQGAGNQVTVTYKEEDDVVSFYIISVVNGGIGNPTTDPALANGVTGTIAFTNTSFNASANQTITVKDADLNVNATVADTTTVTITDSAKTTFNITLTETGVNTGEFTGTLTSAQLALLKDGVITATYNDAKNANNVAATATATATLNTTVGAVNFAAKATTEYSEGVGTAAKVEGSTVLTSKVDTGDLVLVVDGVQFTTVVTAIDPGTSATASLTAVVAEINAAAKKVGFTADVATVDADKIVLTSPTKGTSSSVEVKDLGTTTGLGLTKAPEVKGTAGAAVATQWKFTVTTTPAVGETITVKVGTKEASHKVVAGNDLAAIATALNTAIGADYNIALVTGSNVITVTQATPAKTTDELSVTVTK
uniref:S-layer protein (SlfB) n=1 Tax=Lysinibacillus sphaericus TaxID=1421 RepID=Q5K102_LYSSH|nr:S-layer protein, SlfB [Lysinibacillus sphaericus]CAI29288.1 S-layer protein (SlfB) [Lysinibacillus sphaericus]